MLAFNAILGTKITFSGFPGFTTILTIHFWEPESQNVSPHTRTNVCGRASRCSQPGNTSNYMIHSSCGLRTESWRKDSSQSSLLPIPIFRAWYDMSVSTHKPVGNKYLSMGDDTVVKIVENHWKNLCGARHSYPDAAGVNFLTPLSSASTARQCACPALARAKV